MQVASGQGMGCTRVYESRVSVTSHGLLHTSLGSELATCIQPREFGGHECWIGMATLEGEGE